MRPAASRLPRASSARRASVSTFCTSVGRPPTPRSRIGTSFERGSGSPPSTAATSADSSPARNRSAVACSRTDGPSGRSARRSARAGSSGGAAARTMVSAPSVRATSASPSSTRCGACVSRTASLAAAGSPSAPLPTTTGARRAARAAAATDRSSVAVGKPAPPRPVSPAVVATSTASAEGSGPNAVRWSASQGAGAPSRPVHSREAVMGSPVPEDGDAGAAGEGRGRGGQRRRSTFGWPGDATGPGHGGGADDDGGAGQGERERPAGAEGGAGHQAVHERQRPQQVGRPVDGPPQPQGQPPPNQAGCDDHQHQLHREGAEADRRRPPGGGERHQGGQRRDAHVGVDDRRDHVHDEQHRRDQRDAAVQSHGAEPREPGQPALPLDHDAQDGGQRHQHERHQAGGPDEIPEGLRGHAAPSSGQPPAVSTWPSTVTSRTGTPTSRSQGQTACPRTIAAVLTVLASTQLPAATETVRQAGAAGSPLRGSSRWCSHTAPRRHRRATVEEVARPPSVIVTTETGPVDGTSGSPVTSSTRTRQPPSGGSPATARSPPRETRQPVPVRRVMSAAAVSAVHAFAVAPTSSRTPGAIRTRQA